MPDLIIILLIILGIVLLWRGPKTLPKIGEALGRGIREARAEAAKASVDETPTTPTTPTRPTAPTTSPTDRPDGPA
ncbi:MAG: twin-arginine translocase TatA/TatE family subunit [Chloroflexi bacterium]|nr:twin-arginine translocase TatA/TatE family subunit [Chloroflexota bacterium]